MRYNEGLSNDGIESPGSPCDAGITIDDVFLKRERIEKDIVSLRSLKPRLYIPVPASIKKIAAIQCERSHPHTPFWIAPSLKQNYSTYIGIT